MLVAIIFSMPGADFDTIGWISGAAVMTATPVLAYGLKFILPETDLRLELIFLINLLIATLGIVATVNGRTAPQASNTGSETEGDRESTRLFRAEWIEAREECLKVLKP